MVWFRKSVILVLLVVGIVQFVPASAATTKVAPFDSASRATVIKNDSGGFATATASADANVDGSLSASAYARSTGIVGTDDGLLVKLGTSYGRGSGVITQVIDVTSTATYTIVFTFNNISGSTTSGGDPCHIARPGGACISQGDGCAIPGQLGVPFCHDQIKRLGLTCASLTPVSGDMEDGCHASRTSLDVKASFFSCWPPEFEGCDDKGNFTGTTVFEPYLVATAGSLTMTLQLNAASAGKLVLKATLAVEAVVKGASEQGTSLQARLASIEVTP